MISFRIHEDKENANRTKQRTKHADLKGISKNETIESNMVLRQITNNSQQISFRCPLAPKISEAACAVKGKNDLLIDDESLDKACELMPKTIPFENVTLFQDDEDENDENNNNMSIESISSTKMKLHHDERMEKILYTEPIYRKYIFNYLLEAEHHHRPHPHYMSKQPELNNDMRCILIDWLVSISDEYDLAPATLHMAVSLIDRFLSKMSVVRSKFQLLGVAAMMIASKYEEIHPPDVHEFSSLTKDTCSTRQILKMEELILRVLSFDLTTPTVQTFIEEYSVQGELTKELTLLAMFISELCLVESVDYISLLPSELAASSLALSRHTMNEEELWPKRIEEISSYSLKTLYPIIKLQNQVLEDSPNKSLQAVRLKYSREDLENVTRFKARKLM